MIEAILYGLKVWAYFAGVCVFVMILATHHNRKIEQSENRLRRKKEMRDKDISDGMKLIHAQYENEKREKRQTVTIKGVGTYKVCKNERL